VACRYDEQKRLRASFFFSKGGGDVSHAGKFFTSLAVQLARSIRPLREYIGNAMIERSDIANLSLVDQWRQLVLHLLSKVRSTLRQAVVLVINALDECEDDKQV
jgi:hypothetical protein